MNRFLLALLLAGLGTGTASAQSRELIQLQADVVALSNQVAGIQRSLDERNAVFQQLIEQVVDQVVSLSQTVDRMNGSSEDVRTSNETLSGEMRVLISSLRSDLELMNQNVRELGVRLDTISSQLTAANTTRTGLAAPTNEFTQAQADFYAGNYELARRSSRNIIQASPGSPMAAEAQLLIANSYYNEGQYQRAIDEYDILLQTYRENDKKSEALYKKGLAYTELNQPQIALASFREVVATYPESREASMAQDRILEFGAVSP